MKCSSCKKDAEYAITTLETKETLEHFRSTVQYRWSWFQFLCTEDIKKKVAGLLNLSKLSKEQREALGKMTADFEMKLKELFEETD